MDRKWEIVLGGVGGQGLMIAGNLLGRAAVEQEGRQAVMTSVFGVETRGTFTKSDVIISNQPIFHPEALHPDVVIALDVAAYQRYVGLGEETLLIYDDKFPSEESKARQKGYPIGALAREVGNPAVANVVALGILIKETGVVAAESVIAAIRDEFAERENVINMNLKALQAGLDATSS